MYNPYKTNNTDNTNTYTNTIINNNSKHINNSESFERFYKDAGGDVGEEEMLLNMLLKVTHS